MAETLNDVISPESAKLSENVRNSVDVTKDRMLRTEDFPKEPKPLQIQLKPQLASTLSLERAESSISPAELVLVEKSQDSLQITKRRMERNSIHHPQNSEDSDLTDLDMSSRGDDSPQSSRKEKKKAKTRFFVDDSPTSVSARKSFTKRISEVLGIGGHKESKLKEENSSPNGHVRFQQSPEVIE